MTSAFPPSPPQPPSGGSPARTFDPRTPRPTMHPRRVVGGVRLEFRPPGAQTPASNPDAASEPHPPEEPQIVSQPAPPAAPVVSPGWNWLAQRWLRPAEAHAPNEQLAEGLEYARAGQTRSLELSAGLISARVQGRLPTAYRTELRFPTFDHERWATVVAAMGEQAKYAAAVLSGELPPDIEDLFAPLGLRLFPADEQEIALSCTCDVFRGRDTLTREPRPGGPIRWCKHVCCVMYLVAERLTRAPLTIFALRGMEGSEVLEQLRQARALSGLARSGGGSAPVYAQHVASDPRLARPLDEVLRDSGVAAFWTGEAESRRALDELDLSPTPPVVSHLLLRRLGASPFADSKFPLVGLLATCYELAGKAAIEGSAGEGSQSVSEPMPEVESQSDTDPSAPPE